MRAQASQLCCSFSKKYSKWHHHKAGTVLFVVVVFFNVTKWHFTWIIRRNNYILWNRILLRGKTNSSTTSHSKKQHLTREGDCLDSHVVTTLMIWGVSVRFSSARGGGGTDWSITLYIHFTAINQSSLLRCWGEGTSWIEIVETRIEYFHHVSLTVVSFGLGQRRSHSVKGPLLKENTI